MRGRHGNKWIGAALLGILCVTTPGAAQESLDESRVVVAFQRAADSYAFMHRQIERQVARPDQLAAAIKAARATQPQSVLFTPAIQTIFRNRIARALRSRECEASLASRSWMGEQAACVIGVLPRLPDELEYVVFGRALLLVDRHVRVVVDVFPEALTPTETLR